MNEKNILVIWAWWAWKELLDEINKNSDLKINICWFLDDNKSLVWDKYKNVPVLWTISELNFYIEEKNISEIYICIPSAQWETIRKIVNVCNKSKIFFKIIPSTYELLTWKAKLEWLKELDLEDLLWRTINETHTDKLVNYFDEKTILITWWAWSIGSELVRQVNQLKPKLVIIFDWWENGIYDIQMEFRNHNIKWNIKYIIWDIKNKWKVEKIFNKYKPNIVYHAAAYKHVPLMEENYSEAIENNIIWTKIIAEAAHNSWSSHFVLISTDKAVKPSSMMWTTKRIAEMFILDLNKTSNTTFSAVRFWNVFNSRWSVVPLFVNQIKKWWPITITDKEIVRYFMTIWEAVYLILQSTLLSKNEWELFVLDMWEPIKIVDLAESLIRFFWLKPYDDIKMDYVWLRPWEKIREELTTDSENIEKTSIEKLYKIKKEKLNNDNLYLEIDKILDYSKRWDINKIEKIFAQIILDYKKYN